MQVRCPTCGTVRESGTRYCAVCNYDYVLATRAVPPPAAPPQAPQSQVPQSWAPPPQAPQSQTPQNQVAQSWVPQGQVPQGQVPQSQVPQSWAPQPPPLIVAPVPQPPAEPLQQPPAQQVGQPQPQPWPEAPRSADSRLDFGSVASLPKSVLLLGLLVDVLIVVAVMYLLGHRL